MKEIIPPLGLAAVLISATVGSLTAQEADTSNQRRISVTGTVELNTPPDEIVWNIRLVDEDRQLAVAKEGNDAKIEAVLALRGKLQITEGDLETGHLNIDREYERGEHGQRGDFKYFRVSRRVVIRQSDLTRFDEYLDAFVSSADLEASFHFESSKMRDLRAEARLDALRIARKKAAAMADAVGAKVGRVLTIDEHPEGGNQGSLIANNTMSFAGTPDVDRSKGTMVPGALRVRVTVYTTFELE